MEPKPLFFGIEIPQFFFDGPVDVEHVRKFTIRAEALGYDSLWLQERIVSDFSMLEPVSLLSYAAAITDRVRLGVSVVLLTLRNPLQLAKSIATLDCMSGGRAVLGIGLGGGHLGSHEEIFGYGRERRVRRFTEAVAILKLLWTEPRASFHGTFWSFDGVPMEPKPVQKPHVPIWFGGHHENALRRAVRYGDGWMGAGSSSSSAFVRESSRIRDLLEQAGRDPETFAVSKRVYLAVDDDRQRAERRLREWFGRRYGNPDLGPKVCVWGGVRECTERIREIVRAGARGIVFNPMFDEMEHLEICAAEIAPHLSSV
ncbi:MAG TPA: LLM class flavin-dependent oxidoreductase [candidate division Zixibacteria bacterium]|nr:LLM class flavin-dependent oxidoreductase [candidate division Zixibacteria bacterium]